MTAADRQRLREAVSAHVRKTALPPHILDRRDRDLGFEANRLDEVRLERRRVNDRKRKAKRNRAAAARVQVLRDLHPAPEIVRCLWCERKPKQGLACHLHRARLALDPYYQAA